MSFKRYIKSNLKRSVRKGAKKFLTPEMKEELGIFQASPEYPKDEDFNTFWAPVQSNILAKQHTEKANSWFIGLIVFLSITLLILFVNLTSPNGRSFDKDGENLVVVEGKVKNAIAKKEKAKKEKKEESKLVEADKESKPLEAMTNEEIEIKDIVVASNSTDEVVQKSPLLKSDSAVAEYKVASGDTLEKISTKFYGKYNRELINKIKIANNIRNVRSLQIGQKLIIPFN